MKILILLRLFNHHNAAVRLESKPGTGTKVTVTFSR